ncbi:MAG: hypothetical protein GC155_05845 [Alphaproteobacteria bacterium]|nr:hypothetical protein [Alphaproteobacteria bacterium]
MLLMASVLLAAPFANAQGAPQKSFAECVPDPAPYLALDWRNFDQGAKPDSDGGLRKEWGWRDISKKPGCTAATAELMERWSKQHASELNPSLRNWMTFHTAQLWAASGNRARAIPMIESTYRTDDKPEWTAYLDATLAFLRNDRPGLLAARERLLALPQPADWAKTQAAYRAAGQEMKWPQNIEAVDQLVACFGHTYPQGTPDGDCKP